MVKYTKEQLIAAQTQYNKNAKETPNLFDLNAYENMDSLELAERQIDYLLSLIPDEKAV